MVFPGAEHTRFAHSIGVCHLAKRLTEKLRPQLRDPNEQAFEELSLAALLHDVGHFPFSHTLELVYTDLKRKHEAAVGRPPTSPPPVAIPTPKVQLHEWFGQRIIEGTDVSGGITSILQPDFEPGRVASVVVGHHPDLLLNQILHSDLDVDQLDYLLRDAKATGSTYGHYDLGYLMECMEVVYLEETPVLCVTIQGLHPLEHYVLARYFYYLCILYQKTRCIAEGMLQSIAEELIDARRLPSWESVSNRLNEAWFCGFDDGYVWEQVRSALTDNSLNSELREAISMLVGRRLPRVAHEKHPTIDSEDKPDPGWGAGPDIGNRIARDAAKRASSEEFQILKPAEGLPETPSKDDLSDVLLGNPRPIRVLVKDPYDLPKDTPSVQALDKEGQAVGRLTLLELLADSIVAKMKGWTTYIFRQYGPP